ncbi:MAG TPA: class II aldolase/adducin family protein, partial [Candidatus Paceibacterota bacterium]
MNKKIHIISGGTISHIATHLALCAPAYGKVGEALANLLVDQTKLDVVPWCTKMAGGTLETNEDVEALLDKLISDPLTKIIFMPVAMVDFRVSSVSWMDGGQIISLANKPVQQEAKQGGKRLKSSNGQHSIAIFPADKVIKKIRKTRKDIFLVGFKTTDGVSEDEQYLAGLNLLKEASCNLVLANDVKTRINMVITPEEARYHVTTNRTEALKGLVEMALLRSHLTFTRSTIVAGEPVPWSSPLVPASLRTVVDYLIKEGAYKPFRGATVGHFACKLTCGACSGTGQRKRDARDAGLPPVGGYTCRSCYGQQEFLTSRRKTNFNDLEKLGLVRIKTDGPDTVLAYGSKPSVGGQSQRIVFSEHPEYDCIVHAHVPMRPCMGCHRNDWSCSCNKALGRKTIPVVSQREFECGSHQCGQNTSTGLKKFGNLSAVFLDQHGPNVVFHHSIDPQEVIDFIAANFDLKGKTGGFVS